MFGRLFFFLFTDAVNISANITSTVGRLVNSKLQRDTWRSFTSMVINTWVPWKMTNSTDSHVTYWQNRLPRYRPCMHKEEVRVELYPYSTPAALSQGKTPGSHSTWGWKGFRAGPDGREKSRAPSPPPPTYVLNPVNPRCSESLYWQCYRGRR